MNKIATRLGVHREEVVEHEPPPRAAPDHSLNAPLKVDGDMEWQDWLVDESASQETALAESQEFGQRSASCCAGAHEAAERARAPHPRSSGA